MSQIQSAIAGYILGVVVGSIIGGIIILAILIGSDTIDFPSSFIENVKQVVIEYYNSNPNLFIFALILGFLSGIGGSKQAVN
jgi:ABC-type Na+ efflux pump permease subunit